MPIAQSFLKSKAQNYRQPIFESMRYSANVGKMKSAFLCHSHKDEAIVKGMLAWFQEAGIELYIDWQDHSMPETPNAETARRIQDAIKKRNIFLFLATGNSKASRWCPWELGYADSSNRKIYVIPTRDEMGTYGNEYLGLYPKIDEGTADSISGLAIFNAGKDKGTWFSVNSL